MHKNQALATPNKMVWEIFEALRRFCQRLVDAQSSANESLIRQDAAVCIVLAVQCVEVFFNVYFRVVVSESDYSHANDSICSDLAKNHFGLDKKIKEWPEKVFGRGLDLGSGPGQKFIHLKNMRNELMHFRSSHETIENEGIRLTGLADISHFNSLTSESAREALFTAEDFLCEVLALRGISIEDFPHHLHSWTGRPPTRI